ncbi:helix-turn-helix transcriptional regulator [Telmatospirillum sp.]|uniref:helix-turn-helix transcriptional regulator n=1 Tax=Telmatospirillum sp. TaxID=2079197 RepID=UPI00283FC4AF|nr:helix-turn-helix transcriptional regulator [Telmatospirillum sp.]MDR3436415.1 helix-turn-helix transcriptional regulator [Telmatospirillum sp.]
MQPFNSLGDITAEIERQQKTLSDQLRLARYASRLSQSAAAKNAGVAPVTINNVENGHTKVSKEVMAKLVMAYATKGVEFGPDGWVRLKPSSSS